MWGSVLSCGALLLLLLQAVSGSLSTLAGKLPLRLQN
jgi:hypothetical protein